MPEPSDLFKNVYVKGLGVEVVKLSSLLILWSSFLHSFVIKCYMNLGITNQTIHERCSNLLLKIGETITPSDSKLFTKMEGFVQGLRKLTHSFH